MDRYSKYFIEINLFWCFVSLNSSFTVMSCLTRKKNFFFTMLYCAFQDTDFFFCSLLVSSPVPQRKINFFFCRDNDLRNLFVDGLEDEGVAPVYTTKERIAEVLGEIHDHRKEVRLALRQPGLNYTTVLQTEVSLCQILPHILKYIF